MSTNRAELRALRNPGSDAPIHVMRYEVVRWWIRANRDGLPMGERLVALHRFLVETGFDRSDLERLLATLPIEPPDPA